VVIVTGAASGIGLATAKRFGAEGARVVVADLNAEKAQQAAETVKAAGAPDAAGIGCDVSQAAQVSNCVQETLRRFGRLDVIVNNAGLMITKPFVDLTEDDWRRVLSVDLMGAVFFTKEAAQHMNSPGAIVNVSSIHAVETTPQVAAYAAAKTAILSLTRSSSMELKEKGIRINTVLPGAVDTPMLWDNPNVKSGLETINRADVGSPDDLAAAIAYLASDEAKFVEGTSLIVDGGRLDRL
jgi:NAD(P)-dependent dehydrogenase (short-subunit alcohol dehydrogenase family)